MLLIGKSGSVDSKKVASDGCSDGCSVALIPAKAIGISLLFNLGCSHIRPRLDVPPLHRLEERRCIHDR